MAKEVLTASGPKHRNVEFGVAVFTMLFGLLTIYGSLKVGINWGAEGPKSGFFPFYIGLIIVAASIVNAYHALAIDGRTLFAEYGQLRDVLFVVIPTAVYVAVIPFVGIYLSSMALIALFMTWLGKYRWPITLAVSVVVPVLIYFMFEKWFLVPLPKGPIEDWLNL